LRIAFGIVRLISKTLSWYGKPVLVFQINKLKFYSIFIYNLKILLFRKWHNTTSTSINTTKSFFLFDYGFCSEKNLPNEYHESGVKLEITIDFRAQKENSLRESAWRDSFVTLEHLSNHVVTHVA